MLPITARERSIMGTLQSELRTQLTVSQCIRLYRKKEKNKDYVAMWNLLFPKPNFYQIIQIILNPFY